MIDDRDAVAHTHRLDLVVRHVNRGGAHALLKLLELLWAPGAQFRVEIGQRLIEQEYGWLADERARERDTLALAAGKLARTAVEKVVDAEQLRRPFDLFLISSPGPRCVRSGNAMLLRTVRCG